MEPPIGIAPQCHYSGSGKDDVKDSGFTATFTKEIGENRKLVFIVYSEGPTDVFDTIEWSDEVRQSDLDNGHLQLDRHIYTLEINSWKI